MAADLTWAASSSHGRVIRRESSGKKLINESRIRLYCITAFFFLSFVALCSRLVDITVLHRGEYASDSSIPAPLTDEQIIEEADAPVLPARGDIVDRNGLLLATSLSTQSLFANPHDLTDPADTAQRLAHIFPDMSAADLTRRLKRDSSFIWIRRNLTPREESAVNNLGIPGLYFRPDQKRVYPYMSLLSHLIGFTGVDHEGLSGVEKYFDARLRDTKDEKQPLALSIDLRVQNIVHEEILKGMEDFRAEGATGIVMNVHTGELLAMSSLPDFDPNQPGTAPADNRFDRASLGTYEMGSTFKTFTMAMALDDGVVNLNNSFDATRPLVFDHYVIHDAHPLNRWLTVPEIYAYSSNIGTARMAMEIGPTRQKAFLRKMGMMDPMKIELPERGTPQYPQDWKEINTLTIAYGHGMAVTPLHLVRGFAAVVNGGLLMPLTLVKDGNANKDEPRRVISEKTSRQMRRLTRLVVEHGTARKADVPGYRVGGKTGTAEKVENGRYNHNAKLALFIADFPTDNPDYVVLVMIDDPKGNKSTDGFATGGWIAAPIVGNIISRMAPMLGIRPLYDVPEDSVNAYWINNANQKLMHAASY